MNDIQNLSFLDILFHFVDNLDVCLFVPLLTIMLSTNIFDNVLE